MIEKGMRERARGCMMGQLAGDDLGGMVEFQTAGQILQKYPGGLRELVDGGGWRTLAGQPTDDSEMALMLARSLVKNKGFVADDVFASYRFWLDSGPYDCGGTIRSALLGELNFESEANGAMMRVSPLGIFGANYALEDVAGWAREDAALTHPHPVCLQANELYVMAISQAIKTGSGAEALYQRIVGWAEEKAVAPALMQVIRDAASEPPADYYDKMGWVLIAFQNALYQLLHARSIEEGVVASAMAGGDTDTNAAICGALLGAVYGIEAVPAQWTKAVLRCRPEEGKPGVVHARPEVFWPVDAFELVDQLLEV